MCVCVYRFSTVDNNKNKSKLQRLCFTKVKSLGYIKVYQFNIQ